MKKLIQTIAISFVFAICIYSSVVAQDVGIGTVLPDYRLHVSSPDSSLLKIENTTALTINVKANMFFKTGGSYSGAIKTIGTAAGYARMGLFTYASGNPSNLVERFSILDNGNIGIGNTTPADIFSFANVTGDKINLWHSNTSSKFGIGVQDALLQFYSNSSVSDIAFGYGSSATLTELMRIKGNGNVGIGTSTPQYKLDVSGRARIRHMPGLTAGLWFNKSDNTESTFAGMFSDTAWGLYNSGWKFIFDTDNGRLGIGPVTAQYPLSFQSVVGDKISLYGGGGAPNADHYGFGVQGNLMQLFSSASTADIAFGYGRSAAFTERMRIKGDGNVGIGISTPSTKLQISGGVDAGFATHGFLQLGLTSSANIVIDNNEILARNNGTATDMWIQQDDGDLLLCGLGLGGVGIGVGTGAGLGTGYALSVKGKIITEELRIQSYAAWPDYVFSDQYELMPLDELKKSIDTNNHLPNIPSAHLVESEGILVGDMQKRMMEKIEELTLYILDLHEMNKQQQVEINQLKSMIHHD